MDIDDIEALTKRDGEGWAHSHACRLMRLVAVIGEDLVYDAEVMAYATYLHDWGAFPRYIRKGVPHAERSRQIAAEEILPQTALSGVAIAVSVAWYGEY